MKVITLLFLFCVSCMVEAPPDSYIADYEDARSSTVEAWEELIGPISRDCYERARGAIISLTGTFPEGCTKNYRQIRGCNQTALNKDKTWTEYIFILDRQTEYDKVDTAVHEYIHIFAQCETGDGDGLHQNELYWDDFGADTVEAHGCAGLNYEN